MGAYRHLEITRRGPVEHVQLNRPDVRNALNDEVLEELTRWADAASHDPVVRIAVLSGAGKVFCAGADLTWMAQMIAFTRDQNVKDARAMAQAFEALNSLPIPLIGRIHGAALGGGAGLAAVCDIAVAAEDAIFGFTEAKLGIPPAVISPYAVAKIGVSAARELFLTASRFSASRAREIGLVHAVVPEADLDRAVDQYVAELLTSSPHAVATSKAVVLRMAGRPPDEVIGTTSEVAADSRVSPEGQDGMRAFLEKRRPKWVR